jgi:glucose/arabinose dehydrogenase
MKTVRLVTLVLVSLLVIVPLATAQTAKPVPAPKPAPGAQAADPAATLPAPILAAFKKSYPSATIKNAAKETEDGKTVWEVESIDGGLARDLIYNPDGTVIDIEEEMAMASVPAAVADALKAKYAKATVTKAEKRTAGKAVTYEFTLKGAAVASVEFTPDGKIAPAKKETDKDEKEDDEKAEKKAPIKK